MDLSSSSISTVLLSILRKMADNIWLRVAWKVNHCLTVPGTLWGIRLTLAVVWLIMFLLAR